MDNAKKLDFFNLILSALDYWDLCKLECMIGYAKQKAIKWEIERGRLSIPTQEEIDQALVKRDKLGAIKMHNNRTKSGLRESKHVIEHFIMTGGVL